MTQCQAREKQSMEHQDIVKKYLKEPGVEIGAFKTPIPSIKPIYVDRFKEYAHEKTLADYYGDCGDLPFKDSSLAYVATSHVIEHVANPLSALLEWYRVLQHKGIIYMVVPDRRKTFDHPRPLTSIDHIIEDYKNKVTQVDGTHIEDFVLGVDWSQFSPATPEHLIDEEKQKLLNSYKENISKQFEINIHFHTFEPETVVALFNKAAEVLNIAGEFKLIEVIDAFPSSNPNGFLVVVEVHKAQTGKLQSVWRQFNYKRNQQSILKNGIFTEPTD